MLGEPWFWRDDSIAARVVGAALTPLAFAYQLASSARRHFTTPWRASEPVICVGNASVGGTGKTPFALMLGRMLEEAGFTPHFLSRGYGGTIKDPTRVDLEAHQAHEVGDEPLLLARKAPTWVSRTKRSGIEAALSAGANIIILDDGFQNPTIERDFSILLADDRQRRGNGKVFPAGPMREPLSTAQKRADAIVEITNAPDAQTVDPAAHHTAWLEPETVQEAGRVLAFCGIANPNRFFDMLERSGFQVADAVAFPDHYRFSKKNIETLKTRAQKLSAALITTEKDYMRINIDQRDGIRTLPVRMRISDPDKLLASVLSAIEQRRGD